MEMAHLHSEQTQISWLHVRRNDDDEAMRGYFVHPASAPAPGIVLLQEIFGVNEAMRQKARSLASHGFSVVVPDLFWRIEPGIDLGYSDEDRKQGFGLSQKLDESRGVDDVVAVADWLRTNERCTGEVAYVGFCLGGRIAALAGAKDPRTRAVVSFYGVKLDTITDELKRIQAPFQFHVGESDAHIPHSAVETVQAALKGHPNAEIFTYPGAQHGFFNPLRTEVYDEKSAMKARERMLSILKK
jgi:carboxymethylenebutenolidase